jgi:predicted O-linked N-acetylglucosamine transferase (SPINDLY family)
MGREAPTNSYEQAVAHHQAGRVRVAEGIYRQILSQQPDHPGALHSLGVLAHQAGRNDVAVDLFGRAIRVLPNAALCHANLSIALCAQGRVDEAIVSAEKAVELDSSLAEGHFYLAYALIKKGRADRAILVYRDWLAGHPEDWSALVNLGNAYFALGQMDEAAECFQKVAAAKPDSAEAFYNLGNVYLTLGRFEEATTAFKRAIELNPKSIQAHSNLGAAFFHRQMLDEAMESLNRALALGDNFAQVHLNIGEVLKSEGLPQAACASFKKAMALAPADSTLGSNYLFALQYCPDVNAGQILTELKRWNDAHARPLARLRPAHSNDRSPDRRLRIGYVSAEFRDHIVGLNVWPLLQYRDRAAFEVFCYYNGQRTDAKTALFKSSADGWREIASMTDDQAAEKIREDRIDILLDLAAHAGSNRSMLVARKPARVQAMVIVYPGSTGMEAIDYCLTDPYIDPPGKTGQFYTEEPICLPHSFWCYDSVTMACVPDEVVAPPAVANGHVTFGCLNNFCKINERVLELWARVLVQVPDSRLIFGAPAGSTRRRIIAMFHDRGIDQSRIEFVDRQARSEYFRIYHRIDIVLDTFPYNGHTTSLDAFWMGVPVVTLIGQTAVGRAGWSLLCNLNLRELAAKSPEQFVQIAVGLARDRARLTEIREGMRDRMGNSPLCDIVGYTKDVESAYRRMWQNWCAQ